MKIEMIKLAKCAIGAIGYGFVGCIALSFWVFLATATAAGFFAVAALCGAIFTILLKSAAM